jgi:hypothetical protein
MNPIIGEVNKSKIVPITPNSIEQKFTIPNKNLLK